MPPLTDDLTPAELTGHEDAPLERFCRGGGEGDLAAAFFGFWGRPHHTSLLRGVVDLVIDLEIAAVQVDILDREPGALPCPETGMQEDQKQVAVAAAVGILLHEFQEGGLLLRGEGLPLFFWLPLEEAQPECARLIKKQREVFGSGYRKKPQNMTRTAALRFRNTQKRSRANKNRIQPTGTPRTRNVSPGRFLFENLSFSQVKSRRK